MISKKVSLTCKLPFFTICTQYSSNKFISLDSVFDTHHSSMLCQKVLYAWNDLCIYILGIFKPKSKETAY